MPFSPANSPVRRDITLDDLLQQAGAYDALTSAIAIVDTQGSLLYANPAFSNFNQDVRDCAASLGKYPSLLDCPNIRDWLLGAASHTQPAKLAQKVYYSALISVDLHLDARPLLQDDKHCHGLLLTISEETISFNGHHLAQLQESRRNLVQRVKVLDQEKRASEKLLRVLLKDAPFAMVLMNRDRQVIQINRAAEQLFQTSATQILGQSCETLLNCYQQCACCPAIDLKQRIIAAETTGYNSSKTPLPLLRSVAVVNNDADSIVVEALIDLSERKQAERALAKLYEFNKILVDATGEGIFSVDTELDCTFCNEAAAATLGYTPEEIVGKNIHTLFHSADEEGNPLQRQSLAITRSIMQNSAEKSDSVFWDKFGHAIPVQYLCNPLRDEGKVTGAVVVYRNVAEARALSIQMNYLASHDPLTGLPNRRAFEQRLEQALSYLQHRGDECILCYIDLDQFKIVNDSCGHAAGDELLRQISDMLHARIRKSDTFARLGGDEFGLLLEQCSLEQGLKIVENLLNLIREYRFTWNSRTFALGASIGVVKLNDIYITEAKALSAADAACYIAKDLGRNRIHVYQPDDQDLVQRQGEMEWVTRIKEALATDAFELWAQPIMDVHHPGVFHEHFEVLLRMQGADGKAINPGAFIPAAERFGLMTDIDRWVVRNTLQFLHLNRDRLPALHYCSINLSGPSLSDQKFLEFMQQQFATYPDLIRSICLEITETAAVANLLHASQMMHKLKASGCSFSLDDFGSGMSSFAYLKNLPVDFLKIDGHFVRDMAQDKIDHAMVEAIHRVGSVMEIRTVAEFVESEEILQKLKMIGVDYAQGFAICKPIPLSQILNS